MTYAIFLIILFFGAAATLLGIGVLLGQAKRKAEDDKAARELERGK